MGVLIEVIKKKKKKKMWLINWFSFVVDLFLGEFQISTPKDKSYPKKFIAFLQMTKGLSQFEGKKNPNWFISSNFSKFWP